MTTRRFHLFAAGLFFAFAAQGLYLISDKSPTTDEISFHAVNGYAFLKTRDFRMSPATPPLVREWIALPWLINQPKMDFSTAAWREADSVPFGVKVFYEDNRFRAERLLRESRFMAWLLALGMGAVLFRWAYQLYGRNGALVALGLFAFSPTVVAHSSVAGVDVGPGFLYFLTVYWMFRHPWAPEIKFPWRASIALGLALASKYTAVLLFPVLLLILWKKCGIRRAIPVLCGMIAVALVVTWGAYFFEWKPLLHGVPRVEEKVEMVSNIADKLSGGNPGFRDAVVSAAKNVPIPLSTWILGFGGIARSHRDTYLHYFAGQWTENGIWCHYLVSFLFKTTLAFLILLGWRIAVSVRRRFQAPENLYLIPPVLILFLVTLFDTTGVGMRYLVPVMPFLFIWIGGLAVSASRRAMIGIGALVLLHAASSLSQFPNGFAFFNTLAGGSQRGYLTLRGSDHDWGGELKNLKRYVDREQIPHLKTHLFGTRDESFHGLPSTQITDADFSAPTADVYAISVNFLEHFKWLSAYKPVARVGNAIFIYDLREKSS